MVFSPLVENFYLCMIIFSLLLSFFPNPSLSLSLSVSLSLSFLLSPTLSSLSLAFFVLDPLWLLIDSKCHQRCSWYHRYNFLKGKIKIGTTAAIHCMHAYVCMCACSSIIVPSYCVLSLCMYMYALPIAVCLFAG